MKATIGGREVLLFMWMLLLYRCQKHPGIRHVCLYIQMAIKGSVSGTICDIIMIMKK